MQKKQSSKKKAISNKKASKGKTGSHKIHPTIDEFTNHVLNKLVGIKGTSPSDVAGFILKDWIGDHLTELASYKITVESSDGKLIL